MLYSCTHMATVGVKGLKHDGSEFGLVDNAKVLYCWVPITQRARRTSVSRLVSLISFCHEWPKQNDAPPWHGGVGGGVGRTDWWTAIEVRVCLRLCVLVSVSERRHNRTWIDFCSERPAVACPPDTRWYAVSSTVHWCRSDRPSLQCTDGSDDRCFCWQSLV